MMKYNNAVITKARAIYGRMLSQAQYDELIHKKSVPEISTYLYEHTTYRTALQGVQHSYVHRGQLENLLRRDMFYQYVRLGRYAGTQESLFRYIVSEMEIELVLSALQCVLAQSRKDFIAGLPSFVSDYLSFDLIALASASSFEEIIAVLEQTPYAAVLRRAKAQTDLQSPTRFAQLESALRSFHMHTLLDNQKGHPSGKTAQQLRDLITLEAELLNLNALYRLKRFFRLPSAQLQSLMLPFRFRISRQALAELVESSDDKAFLTELAKTSYGRLIDLQSSTFFDENTALLRYKFARRLLHFSSDPRVVFMAFALLRKMETENIIRIIEGVRYGLSPDKIERLLIRV